MSKKTTIKEFIKRAHIKHNGLYSYSNAKYVSSNIKLVITCKKHGDFEQTPSNHLSGKGCRECMKERYRMTHEEFIDKIYNIFGDEWNF